MTQRAPELIKARKLANWCKGATLSHVVYQYATALVVVDAELTVVEQQRSELQAKVDNLLIAAMNYRASFCGGDKLCGHNFCCACPSELLNAAISKAQEL